MSELSVVWRFRRRRAHRSRPLRSLQASNSVNMPVRVLHVEELVGTWPSGGGVMDSRVVAKNIVLTLSKEKVIEEQ